MDAVPEGRWAYPVDDDDENPEFDRFEELTKKLLEAKPKPADDEPDRG